MGYTTKFTGRFVCTPALNNDQVAYLTALSETRRMQRKGASKLPDPLRHAVGLPLGVEDEYFVGGTGWAGQDRDDSVVNYNRAPGGQPGLWCKWVPSANGKFIKWNGEEKFYRSVEWIEYLHQHFLNPWGINLSGDVKWSGESSSDQGVIVANNTGITTIVEDAFLEYKEQKRLERDAKKQNATITEAIGKTTTAKRPTTKI